MKLCCGESNCAAASRLKVSARASLCETISAEADPNQDDQRRHCLRCGAQGSLQGLAADPGHEASAYHAAGGAAQDQPDDLPALLLEEVEVLLSNFSEREGAVQIPLQCCGTASETQNAAASKAHDV